ncbi:MAG: four helix bundle protein [Polyangiaceae bacterium]|nr:four helix bundle protein [Polyangiaceae bacterium]
MSLQVLDLALDGISQLRPVVARIKRHDRPLAKQITDAANSVVLNIGEGAYNDPGTSKARYFTAMGSANEVRVGVRAALCWGHLSEGQASVVVERYDRVVRVLYRLVHR